MLSSEIFESLSALISDESGGIVQTYDCDAFGNITAQSGSLDNKYQFQDKEFLPGFDLVFYGARYYKPILGRFINQDPLGMIDGPNLYRFCLGDPVNYLDPYGLYVLPPEPGPVPNPNPPGGIPGSGVPYGDIHGQKPDTQPGAEQINSFGCDGGKVFRKKFGEKGSLENPLPLDVPGGKDYEIPQGPRKGKERIYKLFRIAEYLSKFVARGWGKWKGGGK